MARGVAGFADAYCQVSPDILVVLGDRFEMMAATLAALPLRIPVAHIHGGELSFGAIDDAMRHAITKLSHLHFASTEPYARRIVQMGEEPWRVTVSGAPGLDAILETAPLTGDEFASRFGWRLPERYVLATYHPATLGARPPADAMRELVRALERLDMPVMFTSPNPDSGGLEIRRVLEEAASKRPDWRVFESLGTIGYVTAMKGASLMVGNSSSGIIEALSLGLPVVNVGPRQDGRTRGPNVVDVDEDGDSIYQGMRVALNDEFRKAFSAADNPYGDGHAASRVVEKLESTPVDDRLIVKRFYDVEVRP
jgi:UDP-hydrolysing UDP-N-acetyl-D-glucosamine 2-epimerase